MDFHFHYWSLDWVTSKSSKSIEKCLRRFYVRIFRVWYLLFPEGKTRPFLTRRVWSWKFFLGAMPPTPIIVCPITSWSGATAFMNDDGTKMVSKDIQQHAQRTVQCWKILLRSQNDGFLTPTESAIVAQKGLGSRMCLSITLKQILWFDWQPFDWLIAL